jgi:hypothetical protein
MPSETSWVSHQTCKNFPLVVTPTAVFGRRFSRVQKGAWNAHIALVELEHRLLKLERSEPAAMRVALNVQTRAGVSDDGNVRGEFLAHATATVEVSFDLAVLFHGRSDGCASVVSAHRGSPFHRDAASRSARLIV